MVTGGTEEAVVVGGEAAWEGVVARTDTFGTYIGTDEIGFPMAGADVGTGERGSLEVSAGLWGLGGTMGGGVSFAWGLLTLMLIVVLAFDVVTGAAVTDWAGACSGEIGLTGTVTADWLTLTALMVTGETDLTAEERGAEADGGAGWIFVAVLLAAGLMGGTFMEDINTTGGGGLVAGTVLTTTPALALTGSDRQKKDRKYASERLVYSKDENNNTQWCCKIE